MQGYCVLRKSAFFEQNSAIRLWFSKLIMHVKIYLSKVTCWFAWFPLLLKLIPCNLPCIVSLEKYFRPASPETGVAILKEGNTSI